MWKINFQLMWRGTIFALLLKEGANADKYSMGVKSNSSTLDNTIVVDSHETVRALSVASAKIGNFTRLDCNPVSWSSCDTLLSNNLPSTGQPLIVPCGQCYVFDVTGDVAFSGINIKGKLQFPFNHRAVISTPYVIVQGELEISVDEIISPVNEAIKFILTGTEDVIFTPNDAPNENACSQTGNQCNLGVKPFVIAGGEVTIEGMAESCATHTTVKRKVFKDPVYNPEDFATFASLPESCPTSGINYISYDFENNILGNWTGREGAFSVAADGALTVTNRKLQSRGPYLDITPIFPQHCLVPNQDYLFVARMKLEMTNGTMISQDSTCKSHGEYCPEFHFLFHDGDDYSSSRRKATMHKHIAPTYGEYVDFTATVTFTEQELHEENAYYTLLIRGPEKGIDITVDSFDLFLPSESSYPNPNAVCEDLVYNGNAESNGFNPYPFDTVRSDERVRIIEEDGNKFWRISNRLSYSSSIRHYLETNCFTRGVSYMLSSRIRLHHSPGFVGGSETYYWYFHFKVDGNWRSKKIVNCAAQSVSDGWVTCDGVFIIDEELSHLTEDNSVSLRMSFTNRRDGHKYDVDYDDISIRFHQGYVDELVVDSSDVTCWGDDADIHVTSAIYYSYSSQKSNGFVSQIQTITFHDNGLASLVFRDPATLPILSEEDDADSAVDVALLSRNVVVEGEPEADGKGGYMQVLHTPDTPQKIQGVLFTNMGRLKEVDRFALQLLYSWSIDGTLISKNSFDQSNHRCVSVEGTSNVIISDNIGYKTNGHCIHIGFQSESNLITNNLVSDTKAIKTSNTLSGESDNYPAAFIGRFHPNDFTHNIAVAGERHGFLFNNDADTRLEDYTWIGDSVRQLKMGVFEYNCARSFNDKGIKLDYHESGQEIILKGLKLIKNRYVGLYVYSTFNLTVSDSVFVDNTQYGIQMRWSDNLQIENTIIKGVTTLTKDLLKAPYFNRPCISSFYPPVGFKMPSGINKWDRTDNMGAILSSVQFLDFDHSDECKRSIPISFNYGDTRHKHFDFTTMLTGVTFEGARLIDAASSNENGVTDVVIHDIDGSSDKKNEASHGMLVSNVQRLKAFSDEGCSSYPEGISYCANTCYRTVSFMVDQSGTDEVDVRITRLMDEKEVIIPYSYKYDEDPHRNLYAENFRFFSASLPQGSYLVEFVKELKPFWPRFVLPRWEGVPNCSDYAESESIIIMEPAPSCDEIILNGDMEEGTKYWRHRNHAEEARGELLVVDDQGMNGSMAIRYINRDSNYHGIGQNLDSRCLKNTNDFYEIELYFRLEEGSIPYSCDPFSSSNSVRCPYVTFRLQNYVDDRLVTESDTQKATIVIPYVEEEMSMVHGVFRIDDEIKSSNRVFMYLENTHKSRDMIVDNVSVKKLVGKCNEELVRNGSFELDSMYWALYGNPHIEIDVTDGIKSMKVTNKKDPDHGIIQDLYIDSSCFRSGDRYEIIGKFRIEEASTGTKEVCDRTVWDGQFECSNILIYAKKNTTSDSIRYAEAVAIAPDLQDDWSIMAGIMTVTETQASHDRIYVRLYGPHKNMNVYYDEISIKPLPRMCDNLVLNGDFESGDSRFWLPSDRRDIDVDISNVGANDSNYSMRIHKYTTDRLRQQLDIRCLTEGQEFLISAKFRLISSTDATIGMSCTPSILSETNSNACPTVTIRAQNCVGDDLTYVFWNEKNVPWNENDFNDYEKVFTVSAEMATCQKAYVEVGRRIHNGRALLVDDVQVIQRTTMPPTPSPTFSTTNEVNTGPSGAPSRMTDTPSTDNVVACPPIGDSPIVVGAGSVILSLAEGSSLCSLTKEIISSDGNQKTLIPVALSYDSHPWEQAAGEFAQTIFGGSEILCYSSGCQLNLPPLEQEGSESYLLSSSSYSLSKTNEYSRFLETATFGVTEDDLENIDTISSSSNSQDNIAHWVAQQMDTNITPMSSHREFWRKGLNGRIPGSLGIATTNHPCDQYSRWRKVSFVRNDNSWDSRDEKVLRVIGSGPFRLEFNGILRTVVSSLTIDQSEYVDYVFDSNVDYSLCGSPEDRINGRLYIRLPDDTCVTTQNPMVNLDGYEDSVTNVVNIPDDILQPIDQWWTGGEESVFISEASLFDDPTLSSVCSLLPPVTEIGDGPIFGKLSDETWLIFDPRIETQTNTLASPIPDGGNEAYVVSGGDTVCSNAPRSFLNENECTVSTSACKPTSSNNQVEIMLDNSTIAALNSLTGRYVYGIKGVLVKYDGILLDHPCTPGLRSRWEPKNFDECVPTEMYNFTNSSLFDLLYASGDENPYVRDIHFPEDGAVCDDRDTDPEIEIEVNGECWKRVHDEYMSVFDMTYWVDHHPGGAYNIIKWSENDGTFLVYPSLHERRPHGMANWNNNWQKFTYVGRFGDPLMLNDLPPNLRTVEVTKFFDNTEGEIDNSQVLVCGSPGEVSNSKSEEFLFDSESDYSTVGWSRSNNRKHVWIMLALNGLDQLRQRVAWALSQILVVVKSAIGRESGHSEMFLSYYDIFIRNAFGNYRNVLKEVSFNPLMAENLSFLRSKSAAYMMDRYKIKTSAENFAREIMQLFSMGIMKLNMDGSNKIDADGNSLLAYTNDDIMSFSRAWTGFDLQERRGNMEGSHNQIDPMRIIPEWRDRFPKSETTGGYIGDRYPLCSDFPSRSFLRKGATYRFLGSSPLPELMTDPSHFRTNENGDIERVILDSASSLRSLLCNEDQNGNCMFETTVSLEEHLNCVGIECEIETARVVQVAHNAFYEYVQAPCVNMVFYNNAVKVSPRRSTDAVLCANPNTPVAAEACCSVGEVDAQRNSKYSGERMTFSTAASRCEAISMEICDFYEVDGPSYLNSGYFWTADSCSLQVKVKGDGTIAVVHQPSDFLERVMYVDQESPYYYKVFWEREGEYPLASNNCDNVCDVLLDGSCLCRTRVIESVVFQNMPSVREVFEKLSIGAADPTMFDENTFSTLTNDESSITAYLKDGVFDAQTIFEVADENGRKFFLRNMKSLVYLRGMAGGLLAQRFRNSPQFMSFVPSETSLRDAQYETEAVLDHYFYHDNTAPFLALRLIQRLVTSNPSPRYIQNVASAFKAGSYSARGLTFGSGNYGDLAATFAAIYLDRSARSVMLDVDIGSGTLREPILKVLSVMRSMNFISKAPVTRMDGLLSDIGQMVHEFPSVFSFFLPEFKPYGRVGDASLVAPEATLLDMPKIVGLLNGLTSMVRFGLSSCRGGWGYQSCRERTFSQSPLGVLEFNKTTIVDAEAFVFETFEGPSLNGGLDNNWIGRNFDSYYGTYGKAVVDPLQSDNHAFHFPTTSSSARFFSTLVQNGVQTSVKYRYLGIDTSTRGCIGYIDGRAETLNTQTWVMCGRSQMTSDGSWVSCQFTVPQEISSFRIVVGDLSSTGSNAYFDDIQIGVGSENTCEGIDVIQNEAPGHEGYSTAVVDKLSTLMTAGRLNDKSKALIVGAFDEAGSATDGLLVAQQLIITTAEFHTTNLVKSTNQQREEATFPAPTGKPYKAVIYLMLLGGCDSFNMLTPYTCSNGLYDTYLDVRQQVAIPKHQLLPIPATDQVCSEFGIHPELPAIQALYNDGDLLFFANTGVLSQPVNKDNYYVLTNTQLFAHNHMQHETRRIDPYEANRGTGVLGRMTDIMTGKGHNTGSFSVDRFSVALVGEPGISDAPMIVNRNGIPELYLENTDGVLEKLHNNSESDSGFFAETWSSTLIDSISTNELLASQLDDTNTEVSFPDTYLGQSLETISKIIATREVRGVDTDTFYIGRGGFDTHDDVEERLNTLFMELNNALEVFTAEMKAMDLWDNVTLIETSDFARTLNPNGGDGTDHAWGGNYFMMGGSVKGNQVLGQYPEDITDAGPLTLGRGRMIPTTPWEAAFRGIATWLGIDESEMGDVCPNMGNFDSSLLVDPFEMFDGLPKDSPAPSNVASPQPSTNPSAATLSPLPSVVHSEKPSYKPSVMNSDKPSYKPSSFPTLLPSSAPIEFSCLDCEDATTGFFFISAIGKSRNCEWAVRKKDNIEERCGYPEVATNCCKSCCFEPTPPSTVPSLAPSASISPSQIPTEPRSCLLCEDATTGKFKVDEIGGRKDCVWATRNPDAVEYRCSLPSVKRNCCSSCCTEPVPSAAPSASAAPSVSCPSDCKGDARTDTFPVTGHAEEKDCAWAIEDPDQMADRCLLPEIALNCCGSCCSQCVDDAVGPNKKFFIEEIDKRKTCSFAVKSVPNIEKRCAFDSVAKNCCKTCRDALALLSGG